MQLISSDYCAAGCCCCRAEVSNKIHELRHRMEEQLSSRRELEAQLHNKETQKMDEFRSKVTFA